MTLKKIALGLAALAIVAALGAGVYAAYRYSAMSDEIAELKTKAAELDDLKRQVAAVNDELAKRAKQDAGIRNHRAQVSSALDQVAHESPQDAGYLDQPIPDGVRDALRR